MSDKTKNPKAKDYLSHPAGNRAGTGTDIYAKGILLFSKP